MKPDNKVYNVTCSDLKDSCMKPDNKPPTTDHKETTLTKKDVPISTHDIASSSNSERTSRDDIPKVRRPTRHTGGAVMQSVKGSTDQTVSGTARSGVTRRGARSSGHTEASHPRRSTRTVGRDSLVETTEDSQVQLRSRRRCAPPTTNYLPQDVPRLSSNSSRTSSFSQAPTISSMAARQLDGQKDATISSVTSWRLVPAELYNQNPVPASLLYGAHHLLRLFGMLVNIVQI